MVSGFEAEADPVLWTIMAAFAFAITVVYGLISVIGPKHGMSTQRARTFRNSSILAAGWTAVCIGHLTLSH